MLAFSGQPDVGRDFGEFDFSEMIGDLMFQHLNSDLPVAPGAFERGRFFRGEI
jgi:hypothetical protein